MEYRSVDKSEESYQFMDNYLSPLIGYDDYIKNVNLYQIGAFDGENMVGLIIFRMKDGKIHINYTAVAPEYRKMGINARLLSEMEKVAKYNNVALITANVRESNVSSIRSFVLSGYTINQSADLKYPDGEKKIPIFKKMIQDDPINRAKDLSMTFIERVKVPYINFDGEEVDGYIEVNKSLSQEVYSIFKEISQGGFRIEKVDLFSKYANSEASIRANASCGYRFSYVAGTNKLSDHSVGFAIDINPYQNPWVHPNALNLTKYDPSVDGTIIEGSHIVMIFEKYGWFWGGRWKNPDYMHFQKDDGKLEFKNELLKVLGSESPKTSGVGSKIDNFKNFIKRIIK
jgi:ribosomal protein S18 acetylase RimI-like enzyme